MSDMDSTRTEYPALLASLQPEQAVNVLNDRVALIAKINSDIADWLQERRKVEEAYVVGLRKLARRPQQDAAVALGIFQMPWQRIVSGTENLAASHEILAGKIETDVENPLRNWATRNREMQSLSAAQANLNTLAKELSNAQKKAAKGGRRADTASSTVEDASRQWEAQAPYVFEQLQALDESRCNHMRDVLTQFQTHEVDSIEKNKVSAESCLNALLNVETADEIKTFAVRASTGRGSMTRRLSAATGTVRPTSSIRAPPTPPPPRHADDRQSQRSNSIAQDRLGPLPDSTPQKEKGKLGGLKRLGTVMGRRKSTVPPVPHTSNEEKRKTRSFVPFRRGDSSRSFHDLDESGPDLTPSASQDDRPVSSISQDRRHETPIRSHPEPPLPFTNGTTVAQAPLESNTEAAPPQPALMNNVGAPQIQNFPWQQTAGQETTSQSMSPIDQVQQEAALTPSAADESARNFMIRDKPIQEDESEAQMAMSHMANQLRSQAQSSGLNRVQGSVRGRRDVRNTMYVPSSTEALVSAARPGPAVTMPGTVGSTENVLASPMQRPPPAGILHDDHGVASDTTSIHSARSLAGPSQHPDLHEPGLNASVVETVHSSFTETGISKSFVLGEVAFAYNPSGSSDSERETVRLQHFELLDKVAANPIFLNQIKPTGDSATAEEQAGSYTLTTSAIRRSSPMIGLKYQLHMEESSLAKYSPVLITPAWQIVEGQVSVIVLYSLNPVFGTEPLTLKNVNISVALDTAGEETGKAVSAMMAPTQGASFRRKTSAVIWRLNDFTVKPEQDRLLVRFMTQGGTPKQGAVELKFEISGRSASGIGIEKMVVASVDKENDPFADDIGASEGSATATEEKRWDPIPTKMKLLAGRYSAT